jgi:heme O synthase-like polyprenyltransferase
VSTALPLAIDPAIASALALALAGIWLDAAIPKSRDPRHFARAVESYALLPKRLSVLVAASLLLAELSIAALLLLGACQLAARDGAALASAALLSLYAAAITLNLARGRSNLDCGCRASAERPLSRGLVARNAALACASALIAAPGIERSLGPIDALTIGAGGLTLFALYSAADTALANSERSAALARTP